MQKDGSDLQVIGFTCAACGEPIKTILDTDEATYHDNISFRIIPCKHGCKSVDYEYVRKEEND